MRHLNSVTIAFFVFLFLSGCITSSGRRTPLNIIESILMEGEHIKAQDVVENVVNSLVDCDENAFKKLFGEKLQLSEGIDEQIEGIFEKYSGDILYFESKELSGRESRDRIEGKWIMQQTYNCDVWREDTTYNFNITVQIRNLQRPEEEGIQRIIFRVKRNETEGEIQIISETEFLN
jgi:hypothetical protein